MRIDHGLTNTNTTTGASFIAVSQQSKVETRAARRRAHRGPQRECLERSVSVLGARGVLVGEAASGYEAQQQPPEQRQMPRPMAMATPPPLMPDTSGTAPRDLRSVKGQTLVAQIMRSTAEELARQDPESEELAARLWDEAERWRRTLIEGFDDEKARLEIGNQTARKQKQSD